MGLIDLLKGRQEKKQNDLPVNIVNKEIMKPFEILGYTFDLPIIPCGKDGIMLLSKSNQKKAIHEIKVMNLFLTEAKHLVKLPVNLSVDVDKVEFGEKLVKGIVVERYTFLVCSPYTQTNKISKYPLSLNFASAREVNDSFTGRLYYMQDGNIGKGEISIFSGKKNYIFTLGLIGTTLSIRKIECDRLNGGEKEVIYKK